ncbi:MAG: hypothetical protein M1318_03265 [Firmicutes bacterium]|nr:hypothetical protein [Bacillota bacterium]
MPFLSYHAGHNCPSDIRRNIKQGRITAYINEFYYQLYQDSHRSLAVGHQPATICPCSHGGLMSPSMAIAIVIANVLTELPSVHRVLLQYVLNSSWDRGMATIRDFSAISQVLPIMMTNS